MSRPGSLRIGPAGPLLRPHPWCDPFAAFRACQRVMPQGLAFLDSGDAPGPRSRWSYLGLAPYRSLVAETPAGAGRVLADLATALRIRRRALPPIEGAPPFRGGAIGLIGYDAALALHGLVSRHPRATLPALRVGLYDRVVAFDRVRRRCWIVGPDEAAIAAIAACLHGGRDLVGEAPPPLDWRPRTSAERHRAAVAGIVAAIGAGALFQANYTTAHVAPRPPGLDPVALYGRLRARTAAPFGAWLDLGDDRALLCASPERFLHLDAQGTVETRPIKGTAARGVTPETDAAQAAWLAASGKDRAENLMIVDLMRSDLARVAVTGSVRVPQLCAVEGFATVHHLVSSVTARLAPGRDAVDLLRACLPGGSIAGAPKHAAMQLIDRVEDQARGPYCGTVLRIGWDGAMDSNIVIRSLALGPDEITAQAGGGITAQSDPDAEYREAQLKLAALVAS